MLRLISTIANSLVLSILLVFSGNQVMGVDMSGGQVVGTALGVSAGYTAISHTVGLTMSGQLNEAVLKEMFTDELITKLRHFGNWMSIIKDRSEFVGNNVIHLNEIGADPTVLINNTVYPIAVNGREDAPIALSLNKYDTENTKITRDELYALSYNKIDSVVSQHREALAEKISMHALWSLTPAADAAANASFVVTTTGPTIGTRKRLIRADLFALQRRLTNAKVPLDNRHLVLCAEHIEDLLIEDQNLMNQLTDQGNGKTNARIAGFSIWYTSYATHFSNAGAKKAFDSAVAGTDRFASTVIFAPRTWKAFGTTDMFYRDASTDPENRQTVAGFQQYAAAGLLNANGSGAIVSAVV